MEGLLSLLKLVFLAALYLFLYRVVRTVIVEMRPAPVAADTPVPVVPVVPVASGGAAVLARGSVGVVILEPAARAGELVPVAGELTVGRAPGCGIAIPDDGTMSALHARLAPGRNHIVVEDLGSTNGTFVNGRKVTAATKAKRGARVQCGNAIFEVVT